MERLQRVNSNFDLEYDYYRKNLPAIDDSEDTDESLDLYEKIFDSRKTFTILGLDSYIILSKKSLNRIAKMIDKFPQEYVLFTEHQVVDEDKFDKLVEKEKDNMDPIFVPEPEPEPEDDDNDNDVDDDGFRKAENTDKIINNQLFSICLWLYLSLVLCSICNCAIFIYSLIKTNCGFNLFTIYTLILSVFLLFTGIFGFLKCRWKDFSGYILKGVTFFVPCFGAGGIIIFFVNSIEINSFWIKICVDAITIILGIILILYLTGLINAEKINYDNDEDIKHGLINDENEEQ